MSKSVADRLAVCSWSLRASSPEELIERVRQTGVGKVQLALDLVWRHECWSKAGEKLAAAGIGIATGNFGSEGEDYSTLESIRRTGGIVPDETWERNWAHIQKTIRVAAAMKVKYVSFHAGFLPGEPEEPSDPGYEKLVGRLVTIADAFAAEGIDLGLETGQEDAHTLKRFLDRLGRLGPKNVGVNFDPANMILYGKGNPVEAAKVLLPWIRQVHVKDAVAAGTAGEWGTEVPVGTGQVDWKAFFAVLGAGGFDGPLTIEREAGENRVGDVRIAAEVVRKIVVGSR